MNAKEAYKEVKRHTNDKIVLSIAKKFLKKNKTVKWIQDLFGIEVNQRIQLKIYSYQNGRFHKNETVFSFTTGFIFKKTFKIRLA